ncbi:MAG TPA: PhoX family phosphatase [Xanthomonadaceae bacterium]|nr:PhoX family phosphatase [Xanthomonadaceae bacterium]
MTEHSFDPARADSDDEPLCNPCHNPSFEDVLCEAVSRRAFLKGGLGAAVVAMFGLPLGACADTTPRRPMAGSLLGFTPVPVGDADTVVVPPGYRVQVILPWGEPICGSYPAFDPGAGNSAADQAEQMGMHHDGMHFFPALDENGTPRSDAGLLVMNHEYIDWLFLHPNGPTLTTPRPAEEVLKEINAHGVSVSSIRRRADGRWELVRDRRNRRITAGTPMEIAGPARGHALMRTAYSPDGTRTRGTMNNCAHGFTPWGTYLACEENWADYFANRDAQPPREHARYGVRTNPGRLGWYSARGWHTVRAHDDPQGEFRRFDARRTDDRPEQDYRNEPNTFGWIVEIDPQDPDSVPVKRTALGRFAHEGIVFQPPEEGRPLVAYSGDDAVFEYIYKYVSRQPYNAADAGGHLLDEGTLYVARFEPEGRGRWIALRHGENGLTADNGFRDQAEVLINTRAAADLVGATRMDRPEWGAVHPHTREVYFTLTNNTARRPGQTDAANPRGPNPFGHIVRWREDAPLPASTDDPAVEGFSWDIFAFAGDRTRGKVAGRALDESNIFAAPDGLWFDGDGRLWIQTDISRTLMNRGDHARFGNNQMLCADPATGDLRRFLVGPVGQEIAGVVSTPDRRTLFVNVQHPGETTTLFQFHSGQWTSHWPDGAPNRPRSATLVISREDGGVVGA